MKTSQLPVSGQNPQLPNTEGEDGYHRRAWVLGWADFLDRRKGVVLAGAGRNGTRTSMGLSCCVCFQGQFGCLCWSCNPIATTETPEQQSPQGTGSLNGSIVAFLGILTVSRCRRQASMADMGPYRLYRTPGIKKAALLSGCLWIITHYTRCHGLPQSSLSRVSPVEELSSSLNRMWWVPCSVTSEFLQIPKLQTQKLLC